MRARRRGRRLPGGRNSRREKKHRGDDERRTVAGPTRIGIFRGEDASLAARFDEARVFAFAAFIALRVGGERQSFVVAGDPEDFGETRDEDIEDVLDVFDLLGEIAAQDEPVLRSGAELLNERAIFAVTDVEIADRKELHSDGARQGTSRESAFWPSTPSLAGVPAPCPALPLRRW